MYSPLSKGSPVIVIKGGTETRKAWKKRRRTQSPLLLPCTITELPKTETLLGGLLYLLGTHGTEKEEGGAKFMGVGDLEGKWRSVYKCDFRELCRGAGTDLETIVQTRDSNIRIKDNTLSLLSPPRMSKASTFFLESSPPFQHTGLVRSPDSTLHSLSVCIRLRDLSQSEQLDKPTLCWVQGVSWEGDGGYPIMELSAERVNRDEGRRGKPSRTSVVDGSELSLGGLVKGQELQGRVVSVSERYGAAFLDCGVARVGKGGGRERIMGRLMDGDMGDVEGLSIQETGEEEEEEDGYDEDDEIVNIEDLLVGVDLSELEEEIGRAANEGGDGDVEEVIDDVTEMYELNDDDTLYYNDKTTGEKVVVGSISSEDDDDDEEDQDYEGDDNDDDLFAGLTDSERLEAISKMLLSEELRTEIPSPSSLSSLHVGETLRCYVKSVSPQSGRFSLTLNPEPTSLRDEKQIAVINKRVEKLEKSGDLAKIQDARGSIQKGSVIALSKTDVHQFYVKIPGLPVGVATSSSDALDVKEGDKVNVKVLGLDGEKGQMGCEVV